VAGDGIKVKKLSDTVLQRKPVAMTGAPNTGQDLGNKLLLAGTDSRLFVVIVG
jgi:hypothetical protein